VESLAKSSISGKEEIGELAMGERLRGGEGEDWRSGDSASGKVGGEPGKGVNFVEGGGGPGRTEAKETAWPWDRGPVAEPEMIGGREDGDGRVSRGGGEEIWQYF
jgi:hypothetical protein